MKPRKNAVCRPLGPVVGKPVMVREVLLRLVILDQDKDMAADAVRDVRHAFDEVLTPMIHTVLCSTDRPATTTERPLLVKD